MSASFFTTVAASCLLGIASIGLFSGAGAASEAAGAAQASAGGMNWNVDPAHSGVVFKIQHLGVSNQYGEFTKIAGKFSFDADHPESGSFKVTVPSESVFTNHPQRDQHVKAPDFFDVAKFPEIGFTSTSIEPGSEKGTYTLKGDVTLIGVTKPITATLKHIGTKKTPMGERCGVEARFTIKRSDFGMNWGVEKGMLGDEVELTVFIEGTKA